MDAGAESSTGGAAAAAQSGAHIGMQLFHQAVKAADSVAKKTGGAASTAANTASELGEGPFAKAIKAGRRPPDSLVQFLDELHEFHAGVARDLDDAIGTSKNTYRPQFAEALKGAAGDALLAAHDENTHLWGTHYDQHTSAARAAYQASHHTQVLQGLIDNTAEAGQEAFNKAVKSRNPAAAMQVWTTYSLIRPGVSGEFFRWEGWARGIEVIEAVSRRAEGAGGADGGRSAQRDSFGVGGDGPGC